MSAPGIATHKFSNPFRVAAGLLQGKSLLRTLFNLSLRKHGVYGRVLDLGGKSQQASYYRFLDIRQGTSVVYSDLAPAPGFVVLDVEHPFEIDSNQFDIVLAFHLFEHVYHYQRAPAEVFRVLKPGGRVLVSVPFFQEYHADPDDYVRLTDSGLYRCWTEAGFRCSHLEALGEGIATMASTKLVSQCLPSAIRPIGTAVAYLLSTGLDRIVACRPGISGRSVPQRFALGYFGVFEKP